MLSRRGVSGSALEPRCKRCTRNARFADPSELTSAFGGRPVASAVPHFYILRRPRDGEPPTVGRQGTPSETARSQQATTLPSRVPRTRSAEFFWNTAAAFVSARADLDNEAALNENERRTGHKERRAGQISHITTVRLPAPRRGHTTDFWNGLAASRGSRRWREHPLAATTSLPRPTQLVDLESTLCLDSRGLLGFGNRSGDDTHEVPAATWLRRRADGCALVTSRQTPSPPLPPGRPSRLGPCSACYQSGMRPAGARLPPSLPRRRSQM
jgi:hypothetical protein